MSNETKSVTIDDVIKNAILSKCYKDDSTGRMIISLPNSRLDFSRRYYFNGFTNKTVKLSYQNGMNETPVQGKLADRGNYYALYTEGWSFIEHIEKKID